jgi:uncharacterized membrane protein
MSEKKDARLLDVLVATYANIGDAETDLKAIRKLYDKLGTSHNFDAAVISKNKEGKVKIDKTYEAGTRHVALKGLGFGLAAGLAAAIFPPVGIGAAVAAGGVGGAAIGAIVGHVQIGIPRDDLKVIADLLYPSEVALIVVYETNLADQVEKNIKAVNHVVSKVADLTADEIAKDIRRAAA